MNQVLGSGFNNVSIRLPTRLRNIYTQSLQRKKGNPTNYAIVCMNKLQTKKTITEG